MKPSVEQLLWQVLSQYDSGDERLNPLMEGMLPHWIPFRFCRNQMIQAEGEVPRFLYLVTKGLARHFYAKDEKEHAVWFSWEGSLMVNAGFFKQKPVGEQIQAIEPMRVYGIEYDVFEKICSIYPVLNDIVRRLLVDNLFLMDAHFARFYLLSAVDRYVAFLEEYPDLIRRIPLLHIASFLGMSPETLSRIRAKSFVAY